MRNRHKQTVRLFSSSIGVKGFPSMMERVASLEDRALIEMAVAGQDECFSVLMNRHKAVVRKCIGRMINNRSDVEDLVQDTFLKAWSRLSTFRFEANFRTWIIRVAMNEVLRSYRRRQCRPFCSVSVNLETFRSSCESPDEALARLEALRTVRSAIAGLPKKYREILILCELQQLTGKEAARRLESSLSSTKTRLFRARYLLSAALNRNRKLIRQLPDSPPDLGRRAFGERLTTTRQLSRSHD